MFLLIVAIVVPVHISYYKLLTQTIGDYVEQAQAAMEKIQSSRHPRQPVRPTAPESELKIQTNEIILQPQIHVLGTFTPSNVVEFVLNRFGVQKESIPAATYHLLTANLESMLAVCMDVLQSIGGK